MNVHAVRTFALKSQENPYITFLADEEQTKLSIMLHNTRNDAFLSVDDKIVKILGIRLTCTPQ